MNLPKTYYRGNRQNGCQCSGTYTLKGLRRNICDIFTGVQRLYTNSTTRLLRLTEVEKVTKKKKRDSDIMIGESSQNRLINTQIIVLQITIIQHKNAH